MVSGEFPDTVNVNILPVYIYMFMIRETFGIPNALSNNKAKLSLQEIQHVVYI